MVVVEVEDTGVGIERPLQILADLDQFFEVRSRDLDVDVPPAGSPVHRVPVDRVDTLQSSGELAEFDQQFVAGPLVIKFSFVGGLQLEDQLAEM